MDEKYKWNRRDRMENKGVVIENKMVLFFWNMMEMIDCSKR
jgi:hypothetical protein